jgi:hypothetical protein
VLEPQGGGWRQRHGASSRGSLQRQATERHESLQEWADHMWHRPQSTRG